MPARPAPVAYRPDAQHTGVQPVMGPGGRAPSRAWAVIRRLRWTEFRLLLIPSILSIIGMLMVIIVPTGKVQWSWKDLWMSFLFIGLLFGIHIWLNIKRRRSDQVLFPLVGTIVVLGLVMLQRLEPAMVQYYNTVSASGTGGEAFRGIATKQVEWITLGMLVFAVTVFLLRDLNWLRKYKYTFALLGMFLVAITLVFGNDAGSGTGVRLWLNLGFFQFQPSELLKILLVIFLAGYLDDKRDLLMSPYRLGPMKLPPLPYLAPLLLLWALALVLFVVQRDLGSALLFFGIFLSMLYAASGRAFYVVGGLILFFAAAYMLDVFFATQFGHIHQRLDIWLDPWPSGTQEGYQMVQSLYALSTGGVMGTGIGFGSPAFIPAVETDMVISAIGEELGLMGTLAVVMLFVFLVYRGMHIASQARSGYEQLLAVGLSMILGLQTIIIVGGAIKMIPLTGITLPFISYGGSSLIVNFIIVGLLHRISSQRAGLTQRLE